MILFFIVLFCRQAQAAVVKLFRAGKINVLFATNIGSEGMDFKQCQASPVVHKKCLHGLLLLSASEMGPRVDGRFATADGVCRHLEVELTDFSSYVHASGSLLVTAS